MSTIEKLYQRLRKIPPPKPHPDSSLKPYQIKAALLFITKYRII